MEAIQSVADKILQQEYKGTSELSTAGGDTAVNGGQDKPTKVSASLIMWILIFEGFIFRMVCTICKFGNCQMFSTLHHDNPEVSEPGDT